MRRLLPAALAFEAEVADPEAFVLVEGDPEADAAGAAAFIGRARVVAAGRSEAEELAAEAGRLRRFAAVFVVVADPDAALGVDREVAGAVEPALAAAFEAQRQGPGVRFPARRQRRLEAGPAAQRELEQRFAVVPGVAGEVDGRGQRVAGGTGSGGAGEGEEVGAEPAPGCGRGRAGWRASRSCAGSRSSCRWGRSAAPCPACRCGRGPGCGSSPRRCAGRGPCRRPGRPR